MAETLNYIDNIYKITYSILLQKHKDVTAYINRKVKSKFSNRNVNFCFDYSSYLGLLFEI